MSSIKEKKRQKAVEQAGLILGMAPMIQALDVAYLRQTIKDMLKDANLMDATAALNVRYNPDKAKMLRVKAGALESLLEYREQLVHIDELKAKVDAVDAQADKIDKMFGG